MKRPCACGMMWQAITRPATVSANRHRNASESWPLSNQCRRKIMKWFATIRLHGTSTRNGVLHLMDIETRGIEVTSPVQFALFVADHPEIASVSVYDTRFPRKPVPFATFIDKHAKKLWKEKDLLTAFMAVRAQRSAMAAAKASGSQRNPGEHDTVSYEMPETWCAECE